MAKSTDKSASVARIGLDLAKNVFQAHGVDAKGEVVLARKVRRAGLLPFAAKLGAWFRTASKWRLRREACQRIGAIAAFRRGLAARFVGKGRPYRPWRRLRRVRPARLLANKDDGSRRASAIR